MVKASEIKDRAVIGLEHAQKIGAVAGLVFDPNTAQTVGLKVRGAERDAAWFVPVGSLYSIGPDAITVHEAGVTRVTSPDMAGLERLPDSHALADTKVVTDGGMLLGTITDIHIDETNLQIVGYEIAEESTLSLLGSLARKGKFLPAQAGYRYGGDIMLVPQAVAGALGQGGQAGQPAAPQVAPAADYNQQAGQQPSQGTVIGQYAPHSAPTTANPVQNPPATDPYGRPLDPGRTM